MSKFDNITDVELTAEVERRRKEREEKINKERKEQNRKIVHFIQCGGKDLVNFVRPQHRADCSDASHWNAHNCTRCLLLDIVADGSDSVPSSIELELTLKARTVQ